jgi:hypothetical protein
VYNMAPDVGLSARLAYIGHKGSVARSEQPAVPGRDLRTTVRDARGGIE